MRQKFLLFGLGLLLFACGQKGALYLPQKQADHQQQSPTTILTIEKERK